jgi:hypothetical protein
LTPFSITLVLISALIHSSWNFFTKRGNWPLEFFFWVFFLGIVLYLPFGRFRCFPPFSFTSPTLWGLSLSSGFFETIYFVCLVAAYREGDLSLVYPISVPPSLHPFGRFFLSGKFFLRGESGESFS